MASSIKIIDADGHVAGDRGDDVGKFVPAPYAYKPFPPLVMKFRSPKLSLSFFQIYPPVISGSALSDGFNRVTSTRFGPASIFSSNIITPT